MSEEINTEDKKIGRPTLYDAELLKKAQGYVYNYDTVDKIAVIPSLIGLCIYLGINRSTAYDWASHDDKKEFSDTLELINMMQQHVLLNKGLSGDINSNITKLALGNHGFSEKNQTELTGRDGGAIEQKWQIEFVDTKTED